MRLHSFQFLSHFLFLSQNDVRALILFINSYTYRVVSPSVFELHLTPRIINIQTDKLSGYSSKSIRQVRINETSGPFSSESPKRSSQRTVGTDPVIGLRREGTVYTTQLTSLRTRIILSRSRQNNQARKPAGNTNATLSNTTQGK